MHRVKERLAKMERRHIFAAGLVVVLFAVAIVAVTVTLVAYLQKPADVSTTNFHVSGEIVCLPHKQTGSPHTLECAYGLRTDDNRHYALEYSPFPNEYNMGDRVRVTGLLTTGGDSVYAIDGTIKVASFMPPQ